MARDLVEHMVEEADAGCDLGHAGAIEVERDLNLGFFGLTPDSGAAHGLSPVEASRRF